MAPEPEPGAPSMYTLHPQHVHTRHTLYHPHKYYRNQVMVQTHIITEGIYKKHLNAPDRCDKSIQLSPTDLLLGDYKMVGDCKEFPAKRLVLFIIHPRYVDVCVGGHSGEVSHWPNSRVLVHFVWGN